MAESVEAGGGADAQSDAGEAMHVHRPKPLQNWRELLVEIGVIVIGIVIAIGLEQAVEFFHRQHQREALTQALRRDGRVNQGYLKQDIAEAQAIVDWAVTQASTLERAGPTGPFILRRMPGGFIGVPDAGVWPSAKASGVANLLPPSAQNWLEYLAQEYDETFVSSTSATGRLYDAYGALDQVIVGHAQEIRSGDLDLSALNAAQRATVVDRLGAIAEDARGVIRHLVIYDTGNDFILLTPLDQLDTPEAEKRYMQIRGEKLRGRPAGTYYFGGA